MFLFRDRASIAEAENSYAQKHDHASEVQGDGRQNTAEDYTTSMASPGDSRTTDISAVQKMTAATCGSILASLLGMTITWVL